MKFFSALFFIFFVILKDVECPLPYLSSSLSSLSNLSVPSMLSNWGQSATSTSKDSKATTGGGLLSSILSMGGVREKFENFLLSHMPQFPDEMSVQFLEVVKVILGTTVPGGALFITPVIDAVIKKKYKKEPSKMITLNPDTTDGLIFKLMTHKMDDNNLQEFLQIGADSGFMRQIERHFMKSLQQVIDHSTANFIEDIKRKASAAKSTADQNNI